MVKFGIVMPTKGRDTLWEAVESVLSQTHKEFCVIVSCDNERAANMELPRDSRVITAWNGEKQHNDSGAHARNFGIRLLPDDIEFITHLDDDDLYFENRLELFKNFIEKHNDGLDCFYSWGILYKMNFVHPRSSEKKLQRIGSVENVTAGGMCYKRSLFNKTKGWSPDNLEDHDADLWRDMLKHTSKWDVLKQHTFQFIWRD
jgi:glycosyltransferase involved in cell wall biosynthesis